MQIDRRWRQDARSWLPLSSQIFDFQFSICNCQYLADPRRPRLAGFSAATDRSGGGNALEGQVTWTAASPRDSFRIGTFNIDGCKGADGRRDVDRVAACLKDLDFVALNEVHGPRLWERDDQAALLGRRLGVQWLFAPATRDCTSIDFGNGLLTALPVESWQRIPLAASNGRGYRNAVLARLPHGERTISVLLTHIARSDDLTRRDELRQTIDLYLKLPEPAIFLGDLNSEAAEPEVRGLLAAPGVIDAVGQKLGPSDPPRIDFIFVRGLRVLDAGLRDGGLRSSLGLGGSDGAVGWDQESRARRPTIE